MAHFEHSSVIAASREKVFKYVSDINNLKTLMEPQYKIELTGPASPMKKAEEYELRVSRFGISVLWGILIEEFCENELFRDRQTNGPFSLWVHTHKFEDHGHGTLMTDLIEYDVPFGLFGKLADDLIVRRELASLFNARHVRIQNLLPLIK
jgi:ligand-binding SRPBCC domain-containing protein